MQQEIQLNIIPFAAPVEEAEFAFYTAKQDGYCPIHKDDLNGQLKDWLMKANCIMETGFIQTLHLQKKTPLSFR
ncbi:MAG: hypothetical protein K1X61_08295 [Chitinophagales bacterium]|nr:hypothetical protein [Chitinophagales bacterium]